MRRLWVKPVLSHVVSVEPLDAVVGEVDGGGDEPDGVEAAHDDEEGNGDSHVAGRSGDGSEVEEGLKSVCMVSGRCLKGVWRVSVRLLEAFWINFKFNLNKLGQHQSQTSFSSVF